MGLKVRISQSIQTRLFLLLLIALLPILVIQCYIYYDRYETRRAEELQANLEVARSVSMTFDAFVKDVLGDELTLGMAATSSPPLSSGDFERILRESARENPAIRNYTWGSPEGRVLASILSPSGTDFSYRPFFREIVSGREWVVSDLILSKATGEPVFSISRGIRDEKGSLLGIVMAVVVPDRLDRVLAVERTKGAGVSLIDSKGMIVYRHPATEYTWEQRNWLLKTYPELEDTLKGKEIATTIRGSKTGKKRLAGFAPVSSIGWVTAASRAEEEVTAAITSELLSNATLFLLVTLIAFGSALALSRRISGSIGRLRNHALTLGKGEMENLSVAPGPPEIEELAKAFNEMAGKVQSRETALRQSEQRYRSLHAELELRVQARTTELERRNLDLQEFTFVAAHDLSEPLRKIQVFGSLLWERSADRLDEHERDYISRITGAAGRMQDLLDALLRYSRVDTKGQEFTPARLEDVVKDAVSDVDVLMNEVGARVEIGPLPTVMGDPNQLRQLFQNLLANAVKYHRSEVRTVIKIKGEEENGNCRILVEDNGIGFDERYMEKIFQPFQRLHGRNEYPGIGMGLALCRKIVERHHGTITAKSTPGKGSTFIITLPRTEMS